MFEPECQNIDCPQCLLGKIYFDRGMGFYCMLCGYGFSTTDIEVLIEKKTLTSGPAQKSQSTRKKSTVVIRELTAAKAKAKRISRDVIKPGKPKK